MTSFIAVEPAIDIAVFFFLHSKRVPGPISSRIFFAGIRDIVSGRSAAYERELQKAREIAFEEMSLKARDSGANAIVGIDIDYETVGAQGGMLMVSVSGTAVRI